MSDSSGNEAATVSRTVSVIKDSIAPTISLNGDFMLSVPLNQPFVDPGAIAFDTVSVTQSFIHSFFSLVLLSVMMMMISKDVLR